MKTPYQVNLELERIERLVPHLIDDQVERAEEILGFHFASLYASAPAEEHALIAERSRILQARCRVAADQAQAAAFALDSRLQPQPA